MKNTYFIFISFLLLASSLAKSQTVTTAKTKNDFGLIIGNAVDITAAKPVAFATVNLFIIGDSTKKNIQVTDKNGSFEFDKLSFGMYRLVIDAVGFAPFTLDSINVREERYDFNLGDLKMNVASAELNEVVVYSEKPLIENKDGKITYNVGESALSNGSSTAELLKSMPLINNDPDGKILLKGKEPKILIDDKPTDLTADQLKDLLESLPGSSIEKIELMTNPPPQYASEEGGVINIVTRKGKIGFTGKATISGGTRGEGSSSVNGNYRNKKISFNGTVGMSVSMFKGDSYSKRENIYLDSINYFNTQGNYINKNYRPNYRLQADYEINKQQNISISYLGNLNSFKNRNTTHYTNLNRFQEAYKMSDRETQNNGDGNSNNINLSYTVKGKKNIIEVFRIIANGNINNNNNEKLFNQQYFGADYTQPRGDSTQIQSFNNKNNGYSLRLSYDKPLFGIGNILSVGATYQRGNYHNTLNTSFFSNALNDFVYNDNLSNDFKFYQDITTARAAFTLTHKKTLRVIVGAQAENTQNNFKFLKGNASNVKTNYWNVLPNITIRKEFNKQLNTSLVYRASIRRPGITELNPNIDYGDPFNLRFGNPDLLPTLADNFDWNVSFIKGKYYFNTSIGYNKVKDIFNNIRTLIADGKTQTTYQNIATRNEYEASIWGGYTFTKKLRATASAGYKQNTYGSVEKALYKYRNGATFYSGLNLNYTPTNLMSFECNARYTKNANPQGNSRSNLNLTLGGQRKFFNKRLIVSINIIDPISVQKFTTYTYGTNFNIESFNSTNTRNFRLTVAYQLNKIVKKSSLSDKQKKAALDKIKNKTAPMQMPQE